MKNIARRAAAQHPESTYLNRGVLVKSKSQIAKAIRDRQPGFDIRSTGTLWPKRYREKYYKTGEIL